MGTYKKPLKRSFLIAILIFLLLLGLVLSLTQSCSYRRMLYRRYEHYIENVLNYTAGGIDRDDLAECIRSGETSEKYHSLQVWLDGIREGFDLHFLYIIVPLNTDETDNIMNVIAAVSREEYETMGDQLVRLNQLTGNSYSPATAKKYLDAYNSGSLSFFEESSEWGDDYTGLLPLFTSDGERFAALCMDIDIQAINTLLRENILNTVLMIALFCVGFAVLFLWWTGRNITRPLEQLEDSAVRFASTCLEQDDPEALRMELPEINTDNEVESLARAILQMGQAMRSYLTNFVYAEDELQRMTILANKDSLTNVRNKTAYDAYVVELQERLRRGSFPFAILMVDLNFLKRVNDACGHEKGDAYIKTCCAMICEIFAHSPVFRVGGDEFVVVLEGQDYENRSALLQKARAAFDSSAGNEDAAPWERISIAVGMAEYRPDGGSTIQEVLARADRNMYREKRRMKIER